MTRILQEHGALQNNWRMYNSGQLWTKERVPGHEPGKATLGTTDPADLIKGEVPDHESANTVLGAISPADILEGEESRHKPVGVTLGVASPATQGLRPMDNGRR